MHAPPVKGARTISPSGLVVKIAKVAMSQDGVITKCVAPCMSIPL